MAGFASQSASGIPEIDGILSGAKWNSTSLTFSFPADASDYGANPALYGSFGEPQTFVEANSSQKSCVREIMAYIETVCGVTLTELTGADTDIADIRVSQCAPSDVSGGIAHCYLPSTGQGGDVWLATGQNDSPAKGNHDWFTILHEIGHALGLKHGHEGTIGGSYPLIRLPTANDAVYYSCMTYSAYVGDTPGAYSIASGSYPWRFMALDIYALQFMYGISATPGPDLIHFSPSSGALTADSAAQGTPGANKVLHSMWDADVWDLSDYTSNQILDLGPEGECIFSSSQLSDMGDSQIAPFNAQVPKLVASDPDSLPSKIICGTGDDIIVGPDIEDSEFTIKIVGYDHDDYTVTDNEDGTYLLEGPGGDKDVELVVNYEFDDGIFTIEQLLGDEPIPNFVLNIAWGAA